PLYNLYHLLALHDALPILGMHRSGTSCLAGALASAGLSLGESNRQGSTANPRGNFEYQPIVVFHETVLRANGGTWDHPPITIHWHARHRERALALVSRLDTGDARSSPAGFKDPRTLLHLTHWQTLPLTLRLAGIFRHPLACARSLQARDGMDLQQALHLWVHYNSLLLAAWQRQPFPLVDFDLPGPALQAALTATADQLDLPQPPAAGFFEVRLRRHDSTQPDSTALPEHIMQLYQALS